ncbi:heterokaryon incompatibility protein-domain-containing protein [Microdochium bolleyi]|uniref:Heterokaryon incompatibility protein-domain-containing protein n=1 Tax=Microdochium bolleyi TaxID=196109 RepID=A0A136J947_9PEZI|nr:heterokaryon incompatibility protein-domain-containing protein [Microdochium bolleyi]
MAAVPIAYRPLQGPEIRLLSIARPQRMESDERVRCTLHYVPLSAAHLKPGADPTPGRINFRGELRGESPEYFTVVTEPVAAPKRDVTAGLKRSVGGKLSRLFGKTSRADSSNNGVGALDKRLARMSIASSANPEPTPQTHPERFHFSIDEGRPHLWDWTPPRPEELGAPGMLPGSSPTRYTWGDFVALSYNWGPGDGHIVVDGQPAKVTANLEKALREIRDKGWFPTTTTTTNSNTDDKKVMLWVDALCINQLDDSEKAVQIGRMGQIYREAGNVLVWLRDTTTHAQSEAGMTPGLAVDYMQWLSAYYRTEILESLDHHDGNAAQVQQFREIASFRLERALAMVTKAIIADDIDVDDAGWYAIFSFFANPYWTRLWIIQELAMGRHGMPVMCDGRVTQWRHIRDSALIMTRVSSLIAERVARYAGTHDLPVPGSGSMATAAGSLPVDHIAGIAELSIHGQRKRIPHVPREMLSFSRRPGPSATPSVRGTRLLQILALATRAECFMPEDRVWGLLEVPRIRTLAMSKPSDPGKFLPLFYVYTIFAARCIDSGDLPFELAGAGDDEVVTRTENVTVTEHGMVTGVSRGTQAVAAGVTYSLDVFAYVNGFETGLFLPSWVPHLAADPVLRTHPFFGPWIAGGSTQSVHKPKITIGPQPGSAEEGDDDELSSLEIKAVLLDEVISISAIQGLITEQLDFTCYGHVTMAERKEPTASASSTDTGPEGSSVSEDDEVFPTGVVQGQTSPKDLAKDHETARYALTKVLTAGADVNGRQEIDIDPDEFFHVVPSSTVDIEATKDSIDYRLADFVESSADFRIAGRPLREYFTSSETTAEPPEPTLNASRLKQSASAKIWGRRLAITKPNGALCLVPMATQLGDQIWVIPGHPRPVVLRPLIDVSPSVKYCRLIGEAYVDGIMEGEIEGLGILNRWGTVVLC